jgi:peptide/nickel transport system permease protein
MLGYTLRRLFLALPVMGVVSVVIFGILYLVPGDPALVIAGETATPEEVERIRHTLGLDQPMLERFGSWLWRILHFDFGTSIFSGQQVGGMILQRLPPTLSLVFVAVILSVGIGVPLGVLAARRRGGAWDRLLSGYSIIGFSIPVFVAGYLLAFIFASRLHWLPVQGYTPLAAGPWPFLRSLLLPATALSITYCALIAAVTRSAMNEVLDQDYIRTAVAKGAAGGTILFRHALKNAAVPIATVIGSGIATLIGGAVVTESIFAIPGLGRLTVDSILHRDYPVITGIVLLSSAAYVLTNLAVDLLYTLLDPRIRY